MAAYDKVGGARDIVNAKAKPLHIPEQVPPFDKTVPHDIIHAVCAAFFITISLHFRILRHKTHVLTVYIYVQLFFYERGDGTEYSF